MKNAARIFPLIIFIAGLAGSVSGQNPVDIPDCPDDRWLPDGCIMRRYDRFQNTTTVSLALQTAVEDNLEIHTIFALVFNNNAPNTPRLAMLNLLAYGKRFRYPKECYFYVAIGDKTRLRLNVEDAGNEHLDDGRFLETLGTGLGDGDIKKLLSGEKIYLRLCYTDYSLTEAQSQNVAKFFLGLLRKPDRSKR